MSKLRKLKKEKRKNRIKATSCALALALAIQSAQGLGTYALFTDSEDVASNLAISTGDVDVEVVGGNSSFQNVRPGSTHSYQYIITNQGTLRQQLKLGIDIPTIVTDSTLNSALDYLKSNISYSVDFGIKPPTEGDSAAIPVPDNEVGGSVNKIDNIKLSEEKILKSNSDENIFILEPGQQITVNATITIPQMYLDSDNDGVMDYNIQNALNSIGNIQLDVKIEARQISYNINQFTDYGFYDVAVHSSNMTIEQKEIITIATGEKAYFTNGSGNSFKKLYIPVNIKSTTSTVTLEATVVSTGNGNKPVTATYEAEYGNYPPYGDYILITAGDKQTQLPFKGVVNITIKVTVNDGTKEEIYYLECNVTLLDAGNNCSEDHPDHGDSGNGGKCHGEVVYSGHQAVLNITQEGEAELESPEVVEPSEEVELPSPTDIMAHRIEEVQIEE